MRVSPDRLLQSDQEILQRIVDATGMQLKFGDGMFRRYDAISTPWNPLGDDGDALELAVQVGLTVKIWPGNFSVTGASGMVTEIVQDDLLKALRRAIVEIADQDLAHKIP